jgi:transposase
VQETYRVFVGIDWGTEAHQVWVTDAAGTCLGERKGDHTGAAIVELATWLVNLAEGQPDAVAVALEMPRGPIVDTLLERGCHLFAINPKQLDRFRDRFSPAGAKDDRRDALVLSSAIRTDRIAFRRLEVDDPLTMQLREYSRQDTELGEDLGRLTNRLRDHLLRTWPEVLHLVPAADERWLWALLTLAPTPADGRHLRPGRLRQLLREYRIRRITVEELVTVLRTPSVQVAPGVREGVRVRILDLVEQLPVLDRQRRAAERRLVEILEAMTQDVEGEQGREHPDVTILQSLPGMGTRIAAAMLAEAAPALRNRAYHAVRQLGGAAPVTKRSGKTCVVIMRYACNGHLQRALYHWGRGLINQDARSRAHYAKLRRAGHTHGRAIRGVVDRILAVLIAMLKHGTLYDAGRRTRTAVEKGA